MFCTRCGLRLEEGAAFCHACGQQVEAAAGPSIPTNEAISTSQIAMPALAATPVAPYHTVSPQIVSLGPYAGFWLRVFAHLIDGVILTIPFMIVFGGMALSFGGFGALLHRPRGDDAAAAALVPVFFLAAMAALFGFVVVQWLYFAKMESSPRQATFGKSAMSLRVTGLHGEQLTFGQATGRFFAKLVSGLIPFGIGYIMAGFTEKKQALHDMIAGSLVLRKL